MPFDASADDARRAPGGPGGSGGWIALAGRLGDAESVERAALAAAVHPQAVGFERAWLLVWNARAERLEERAESRRPEPAPALARWLGEAVAQRLVPESSVPRLAFRPQALGTGAGEAWSRGVSAEAAETGPRPPWADAAHVGAFALRRSGLPAALVVGIWSAPPDEARRAALDTASAACEQALAAIDGARELKARTGQASALAEVARAAGSALELREVLDRVTRSAARGTRARGAALWLSGPGGLRVECAHGPAGGRERAARSLAALATTVAEEGCCRVTELALDAAALADPEPVLVCPLRACGRVLGALACHGPAPGHPSDAPGFSAVEVEFVSGLADLAALAVERAAGSAQKRHSEQEKREWLARLQRQERLAWLGELATRMAREARNPLASILAFTRRVQRTVAESDPNREYLDIVLREGERLERLLEEQLAWSAAEGALRFESLNAVVQEAVDAAADILVRRRVRLAKKLSPDLPPLLLDRERVGRMVRNVLASALESVSVGGRVRLETRAVGASVLMEVAHDGPHAAGDLLEQVFVPFAGARPGGAGQGLAVAQQIVREHGGQVRVRGEGEWGTVVSLTLPVHRNSDRRQPGPDRRQAHADRRADAGA